MREEYSTSEELFNIQELDRERIAKELHDTSLQNLTHLIHKINLAELYIDKDANRAKMELEDCRNYVKGIVEDIRQTIFYIQPMTLSDIGLTETLYQYFDAMKNYTKMDIYYEIDSVKDMSTERMMNLYRIIQECVRNSISHSSANKINFSLKNNGGKITIRIEDDGLGFDVSNVKKNHYGLQIVKSRVKSLHGIIDIKSEENKGTCITINVPNVV